MLAYRKYATLSMCPSYSLSQLRKHAARNGTVCSRVPKARHRLNLIQTDNFEHVYRQRMLYLPLATRIKGTRRSPLTQLATSCSTPDTTAHQRLQAVNIKRQFKIEQKSMTTATRTKQNKYNKCENSNVNCSSENQEKRRQKNKKKSGKCSKKN